MLGAAIVVFRESFEAALLIGIIAAATRELRSRSTYIATGVLLGVVGAIAVASLAGYIAEMFEGIGQELFNALILAIAVCMLAWHNIWMSTHGTQLANDARSIGREVKEGRRELSAVMIAVSIAVLREGSETALFLYGLFSSGQSSVVTIGSGGAVGLLGGIAVGAVVYGGIVRLPVRWFFTITSVLILMLAASMASQMARFLAQAGVLPSLATPLWDLSAILPVESLPGAVMHGLVGYEATPAGIQVVVYVTVVVAMLIGMHLARHTDSNRSPTRSAGAD